MKTIVLVVLVAAAGCGSKKGSDCAESIGKGIETVSATIRGRTSDPQALASMVNAMTQLKVAVTKRCTEDRWPSDVVECFRDTQDMGGLQDCQGRLEPELRAKLNADVREIRNASRQQMPNVPGHPQTLRPGAGAPGGEPGSSPPTEGGSAAPAPAAPAPAAPAPAAPAPAAPAPAAPPPAGSASPTGSGPPGR